MNQISRTRGCWLVPLGKPRDLLRSPGRPPLNKVRYSIGFEIITAEKRNQSIKELEYYGP